MLFQILRQEIIRSFRPKLVSPLRVGGYAIDPSLRTSVLGFVAFNAVLLVGATVVVAALEPSIGDMETAVGAVLATALNIGPGFGGVGPTDNFSGLGDTTLVLLSGLMLLGRLEIYAVTALLTRSLWKRY